MSRDFHATYLTDARAMDAARDRAVRHGEDGWAAAYTVALTLPAAPGSHTATGARDVLVPDTLPDVDELARLADAAPTDPEAAGTYGGYYEEPNIDYDNPDMAPSMVRRARPDEIVRPDLRCPPCCEVAGQPEETGMPDQAYRCTACGQLWEYTAPHTGDSGCRGSCSICRSLADADALLRAQLTTLGLPERAGCFGAPRSVPAADRTGVVVAGSDIASAGTTVDTPVPDVGLWQVQAAYRADRRSGGFQVYLDELTELIGPARYEFWAAVPRTPPPEIEAVVAEGIRQRELLSLLSDTYRGLVTVAALAEYPATSEARRRQLLSVGGLERSRDQLSVRRVQLTALGRITYRELRSTRRP